MSAVVALFSHQLFTFVLVLARTGTLVLTAPMFGHVAVPRRVRGLLAVALAMLITPLCYEKTTAAPNNLIELSVLFVNEALVGLLLGIGVNLLFTAVQVAGQLISQLSGMSLADVFNPAFNAQVPMISQFLFMLTLAMLVCLNGHRLIVQALLMTFETLPPGNAALGDNIVDVLSTITTTSLSLGIRAGAPVMIALLLSTLVLGLVSRTLPQINIIAVGFSINALLTLGVMFLALGTVAWTLQEETEAVIEILLQALGP